MENIMLMLIWLRALAISWTRLAMSWKRLEMCSICLRTRKNVDAAL